jgi:uncharacterized membrane protein YdfJ with MMPL/SSD domain
MRGGRRQRGGTDGLFGRLARAVVRHPIPVAVAVSAVLFAVGMPFLGVTFSSGNDWVLPTSQQ